MNTTVIASLVTGVLAIGAGVAIAGISNDPPDGVLVITDGPTTTSAIIADTVAPLPLTTTTTQVDETTTTTMQVDETTTTTMQVDETTTTTMQVDETTTTTMQVDETTTTTMQVDETTTTTTINEEQPGSSPLVERAVLFVVTANAAGVGGIATATANSLDVLGYTDVHPVDAVEVADTSVVFHTDGHEAEAARLASDLGWPIDRIAPIGDLPELTGSGPFELVALIGVDQAGPLDDE